MSFMVCHLPSSLSRLLPFVPSEVVPFVLKHHLEYNMVATVQTDTLENAFRDTNSVNSYWWDNENIESDYTDEKGCRSTSVGDIIINDNNDIYVVAGHGFELVKKG